MPPVEEIQEVSTSLPDSLPIEGEQKSVVRPVESDASIEKINNPDGIVDHQEWWVSKAFSFVPPPAYFLFVVVFLFVLHSIVVGNLELLNNKITIFFTILFSFFFLLLTFVQVHDSLLWLNLSWTYRVCL